MTTLHRETAYALLGISFLGCAESALERVALADSDLEGLSDFYESARTARESSDDTRLNCLLETPDSGKTRAFRVSPSWLAIMSSELGFAAGYSENNDGTLNCGRAHEIAMKYRDARTNRVDSTDDDSVSSDESTKESSTWILGSSKSTLSPILGIDIPDNEGDFNRCTATIVSRGILATAAHCFDETPTEHGDIFKLTIHYMDSGKARVARDLTAYPVWKNYDGIEDYEDDFALIHVFQSPWINNKSHVLPMYVGKIKSKQSKHPSKLKVYGWGMLSQKSEAVARSLRTHKRPLSFSSVSPTGAVTIAGRNPRICEGDSGGPWLLRGAVALTTAEWGEYHKKESLNCMRRGDEMRTSGLGAKAEWIEEQVRRHTTRGKKGRCKRSGSLLRCS